MRFFDRRTQSADGHTAASLGKEKHNRNTIMSRKDRKDKSRATYGNGELNRRPKFGQWLKVTWPDILTSNYFYECNVDQRRLLTQYS